MFSVIARAPTRMDIAGGTLDLWPLHHMIEHKCTVNIALNLMANVEIRPSNDLQYHLESVDQKRNIRDSFVNLRGESALPLHSMILTALWDEKLPPLHIRTRASSPKGAGLGGSSSLGIAIAGGLNFLRHKLGAFELLAEDVLVRLVANVEAKLLGIPTGTQDHWAAIRGALNIIRYPLFGERVETIEPSFLDELEQNLVVCYSGESRISGKNNWEFYKRIIDGDKEAVALLQELGEEAEACAKEVKRDNFSGMITHSLREWELRKRLWPTTETEKTRQLECAARSSGAFFSRICGAGGGGVMVFLCPPDLRKNVIKTLGDKGGKILDASIVHEGLRICEAPYSVQDLNRALV